jgi:hypothetical protein
MPARHQRPAQEPTRVVRIDVEIQSVKPGNNVEIIRGFESDLVFFPCGQGQRPGIAEVTKEKTADHRRPGDPTGHRRPQCQRCNGLMALRAFANRIG